jgi:hypothetical protein
MLPASMNEPQQLGWVTRTSTSGRQHATGQPPWQTHSERTVPNRSQDRGMYPGLIGVLL